MTESENLLEETVSHDEQLYHEMEIVDRADVETRDSIGCVSISGSTRYILAAIVASIGGILFGYDLGIVSGAMLQLKQEFQLDCREQEMIVSSVPIGAVIGSLVGGYITDYFGRRRSIIINSIIFFCGAALLTFSPSFALLIVGRLVVGFGMSLSAIAECIYIAEIAPPKRRGLLVSLNEIGIVFGLLLAYFVNFLFINATNGWRYMFGLSGIPALIQGYGVILLPPSPRWLVCQGKDAKALRVMKLLNHGPDPEQEISKMKDALNQELNYNVCYLFGRRENMRGRMIVGLGVVFCQQFTGQPSVLYYAPSIFENIGFRSHSAATLATVGIGFSKLIATIITLCLVDKAGRRRFLIFGSIVMTVSLCLLYAVTMGYPAPQHKDICDEIQPAINHTFVSQNISKSTFTSSFHYLNSSHHSQSTNMLNSLSNNFTVHPTAQHTLYMHPHFNNHSTPSSSNKTDPGNNSDKIPTLVKYITVVSLMAFAGGYSCGYGPVNWLVLSEIFPSSIKGRAFAAATVLNWGSNLVISLTLLDLIDAVGVSWTFFSYGVVGCLAIIFVYKFVPETKGRSLEEINALFSSRNSSAGCTSCLKRNTHYNSLTENDVITSNLEEWSVDT